MSTEQCNPHRWISDPDTQESLCSTCGIIEQHTAAAIDPEKELDFQKTEFKDQTTNTNTNNTSSTITAQTNGGCIIPHGSHVDFSNGGFLSTKIDARSVDFQGRRTDRCYTNKLKYNHNNMQSAANPQTLKNSIWRVSALGDRLNLPKYVQERVAQIFHSAYGRKASVHNSTNMVGACIFFACKEAGLNKKMIDIARMMVDPDKKEEVKPMKKSIFACYEKLVDPYGAMNMSVPKHFTVTDDIIYVGNKIGLPEPTIRYTINMYRDIKEKDKRDKTMFAGKSARITAMVLLYISAKIHNDFIRMDNLDLDNFLCMGGAGISQYILQKKADDYLKHPYFAQYAKKVEEKKILI